MKKYIAILTSLLLLVSSFLPLTSHANTNTYEDLIISEYIEGSSYNKAIELYNGTDADIDLSQYTLVNFSNGADQAGNGFANTLDLLGTLAPGEVIVVANSQADQAILDVADLTGSSYFYGFNGDDAIVLFKNYDEGTRSGTVIDSIGKVGEDPGSSWSANGVSTIDATLVRNTDVLSGDTTIDDHYDPSKEWTALFKDTFEHLGSYPDEIVIEGPKSEYVSTVERVVDGDTIVLETPVLGVDKVRYLNIDTPETYHQGSYDINLIDSDPDHSQKYHGELAKDYLNSLLKPGDEVIVKVGEEAVDQYGRLLAQIIRKSDGLNTNLEMVRAGHAVTYFIYPVGDEATYLDFQAAVKEAMDNKLGIWNEQSPVMELPFEFRARDMAKGYSKFVGNSDTMQYVQPNDYKTVPVEKRVFFVEEMEAIMAGYSPGFDREPIIADARYAQLGSTVTVEGIVTYVDGKNYYISDYSGGIIVRSYNLDANIGDTIRATGKTSEYYGMLQVYSSQPEVISTGGTVEPYSISAAEIGENTEGQFVALEDVKIISVNEYNEYTSVDPSGAFFKIDTNETLDIGDTYDNIIGVINYSYGSYKVITRSAEDVIKDIPVISINDARTADLETKVHVEGIVTAAFDIGGRTNYYVQDESGAIVVRVKGFTAEVGDKIRAKARTEEYFGMLQIQPYIDNVELIEAGVGAPEPKLITSADLGEEIEGQLVEIKYATIHSKNKYNDYYGSDLVGEFTLDSDNQYLDVETTYETIIGVVDYNYSEYKVTPRSFEDTIKLDFFTEYVAGSENLTNVVEAVVEAYDNLENTLLKELLIAQLKEVFINDNSEEIDEDILEAVEEVMEDLIEMEEEVRECALEDCNVSDTKNEYMEEIYGELEELFED
jgi:endonuclease YncB( thermonuclease family)